jgi:hypothetical protein
MNKMHLHLLILSVLFHLINSQTTTTPRPTCDACTISNLESIWIFIIIVAGTSIASAGLGGLIGYFWSQSRNEAIKEEVVHQVAQEEHALIARSKMNKKFIAMNIQRC